MSVETLEFGEEMRIRKMAVDDPDRIIRIERRDQVVSGFTNGLHVPGGDVAGSPDQSKTLHVASCFNGLTVSGAPGQCAATIASIWSSFVG